MFHYRDPRRGLLFTLHGSSTALFLAWPVTSWAFLGRLCQQLYPVCTLVLTTQGCQGEKKFDFEWVPLILDVYVMAVHPAFVSIQCCYLQLWHISRYGTSLCTFSSYFSSLRMMIVAFFELTLRPRPFSFIDSLALLQIWWLQQSSLLWEMPKNDFLVSYQLTC